MIHPAHDGRWTLSYFCAEGHRHRTLTEPLTRREALVRHAQASGGPCPKALARQAKEAAARARQAQAAARTFFETVTEYLAWAAIHRPRSYPSRASRFNTWKAMLGDGPLTAITVDRIEQGLHRGRDGGWKPSTYNRHRQAISHLFEWACKRGYARENPARVVEHLAEANEAPFALTADQEAKILARLTPAERTVFRFALHTGLRFGELVHQEWRHVDLMAGTLTVTFPKHVKPQVAPPVQVLPLNTTARAILRGLERTGPRVFPALTSGCLQRVRAACRAVGLPAGVGFHKASRDSFTSRLSARVPTAILMQLTRHKSYRVARRYIAPDLEGMRVAVNTLDDAPRSDAPRRGDLVADAEALLAQVGETQAVGGGLGITNPAATQATGITESADEYAKMGDEGSEAQE